MSRVLVQYYHYVYVILIESQQDLHKLCNFSLLFILIRVVSKIISRSSINCGMSRLPRVFIETTIILEITPVHNKKFG